MSDRTSFIAMAFELAGSFTFLLSTTLLKKIAR